MLDHGIILRSKRCLMRPMTDADEDDVLTLWNQDFVVGNLFMSKASREEYRCHFEAYKANPDQFRWVIEDAKGRFVGTAGRTRVGDGIYKTGFFALYPTEEFLAIEPLILGNNYWFGEGRSKKAVFTVVSANEKIKKMHRFLGARDTGERTTRRGSDGRDVVLEHWEYDAADWLRRRARYEAICI